MLELVSVLECTIGSLYCPVDNLHYPTCKITYVFEDELGFKYVETVIEQC